MVPFINHEDNNANFFSEVFNSLDNPTKLIESGQNFGQILVKCGIKKYSLVGTDIGFTLNFSHRKIDGLCPPGTQISALSDSAIIFEISELDRVAFELKGETDPVRQLELELYQKNLNLFILGMQKSDPDFDKFSLSRQTIMRIKLKFFCF